LDGIFDELTHLFCGFGVIRKTYNHLVDAHIMHSESYKWDSALTFLLHFSEANVGQKVFAFMTVAVTYDLLTFAAAIRVELVYVAWVAQGFGSTFFAGTWTSFSTRRSLAESILPAVCT
jgi:hypothetical protein